MRDSFTSGQPLYLLYSYSKPGVPEAALRLATLLPTHAIGKVRLQVTGSPPTTRVSDFLPAHPSTPNGRAVAARPRRTCLRDRNSGCITLPRSLIAWAIACRKMLDPQVGQMLLQAVLLQPLFHVVQIDDVERLVLPGAAENGFRPLTCRGIYLPVQAMGAHTFQATLHRGVDGRDYRWPTGEKRREHLIPFTLHGPHCARGCLDQHLLDFVQRYRRDAERSHRVLIQNVCQISNRGDVLGAVGEFRCTPCRHPDGYVGRGFELFLLIDIGG